jgi:hypothetical protein
MITEIEHFRLRWLARRLGLSLDRAKLIAGLAFHVEAPR